MSHPSCPRMPPPAQNAQAGHLSLAVNKYDTDMSYGHDTQLLSVIGVGAQSTLGGGHQIFARKMCIKNQQNGRILYDSCPKNYKKIPTLL